MEQLLKILEDNARLPIEDIATMLNKSPCLLYTSDAADE